MILKREFNNAKRPLDYSGRRANSFYQFLLLVTIQIRLINFRRWSPYKFAHRSLFIAGRHMCKYLVEPCLVDTVRLLRYNPRLLFVSRPGLAAGAGGGSVDKN